MIYHPHQYQSHAIKWLISKTLTGDSTGAALFLDPGLGKTTITLSWIKLLREMELSRGVLVVAPLRVVYSVWPQECKKWEQFAGLRTSIVHGPPTKKQKALATPADIYITNPESVHFLAELAKSREMPFDTLVVDESSKFKSWSTKRTKAIRKLIKVCNRRVILTGTPSPNGLQDLFSQIFIVDEGKSLGKTIGSFRQTYFYQGGFGGYKYFPIDGSEKRIYDKIAGVCLRMSADEFLDLPPILENNVFVDLEPKVMARYKQLEKEMFLAIDEDGGELTPMNAGARYNACRQLASGGVYDADDKTEVHEIHSSKADAVQDIVEELQGKPVLIAFQYRHELERLRKIWKKLPSIDGKTKPKAADKLVEQWNAGDLPLLAVQPKSLSHGVNMQAGPGRDIIWTCLSDSLEDYQQLNARLHRQGVTGQVRIHRITARDTVDEAVVDRIESKEETQNSLLDALQRYRQK